MQLVPKTDLSASVIRSTPTTEMIALDVRGMKCAGCVKVVEKQLTQNPNVVSACVNLVTEVAVVECAAGAINPATLAENLTAAGFPTHPRYVQGEAVSSGVDPEVRHRQEMNSAFWQLVVAGVLLILSSLGHLSEWGMPAPPGLHNIWLHFGLATATLIGPGRPILIDGWRGLRRNAPNMNTLVGMGTLTAYTASLVALLFPQLGWDCFFDEPVMLLGFILLGRTLEQQARGRAASAFRELLALQPQIARLIADPTSTTPGKESVQIPADRVRVGEWLQVLPGEKIPVDGEVVAGKTTIDESMLTGEAIPVRKQPGDAVSAGTINQSGTIALRATRTGKDTILAQIVALVEAAQTRKAPVQKLADTLAGYFTYGVLAAAAITFLFWYFIGTHLWVDVLNTPLPLAENPHAAHQVISSVHPMPLSPLLFSLKLAIAVMVVACPCALGLATPTAILVGTGVGAERGLLIKGGDVLERVHQLATVVFDKTGTLTTGMPRVSDFIVLESPSAHTGTSNTVDDLLQLAAAAESGNSHPLAVAIQHTARQRGLAIPDAQDFEMEPGLGISAQVSSATQVLLGNRDWVVQHGVSIDEAAEAQSILLASAGKTVVYVAANRCLIGLIALTDTLRPDAVEAVNRLRQMGLEVMILTGDRQEVAQELAQQLAIESKHCVAGVRPDGKAAAIQRLQAQNRLVAMVGDGINDAPALSQADVGIALKTGTDVAMETAEIVLMRDRLTDVVTAIELSRATFNKIRQNLFWAFAYNTLGIPIAAGALLPWGFVLSPAAAGALMAFSSISVVTNSLLLRRFRVHASLAAIE